MKVDTFKLTPEEKDYIQRIGRFLIFQCKVKGISQREMWLICGLSRSHLVYRTKSGKGRSINLIAFRRMAKALDLDIAVLLSPPKEGWIDIPSVPLKK